MADKHLYTRVKPMQPKNTYINTKYLNKLPEYLDILPNSKKSKYSTPSNIKDKHANGYSSPHYEQIPPRYKNMPPQKLPPRIYPENSPARQLHNNTQKLKKKRSKLLNRIISSKFF